MIGLPSDISSFQLFLNNLKMFATGQPMVRMAGGKPRDGRWPAVRKRWLLAHPTCAGCGGTVCLQVHHVRVYHLYPELELDDTNFLTLCEAPGRMCHLLLGHLGSFEDSWNPHVREESAAWLLKLTNRPSAKRGDK